MSKFIIKITSKRAVTDLFPSGVKLFLNASASLKSTWRAFAQHQSWLAHLVKDQLHKAVLILQRASENRSSFHFCVPNSPYFSPASQQYSYKRIALSAFAYARFYCPTHNQRNLSWKAYGKNARANIVNWVESCDERSAINIFLRISSWNHFCATKHDFTFNATLPARQRKARSLRYHDCMYEGMETTTQWWWMWK